MGICLSDRVTHHTTKIFLNFAVYGKRNIHKLLVLAKLVRRSKLCHGHWFGNNHVDVSLILCRFVSKLPVHALGSGIYCDNIPGLSSSQKKLCREYPDIMANFAVGITLAADECEHQFRNNRWNCSILQESDSTLFTNFLLRGEITLL